VRYVAFIDAVTESLPRTVDRPDLGLRIDTIRTGGWWVDMAKQEAVDNRIAAEQRQPTASPQSIAPSGAAQPPSDRRTAGRLPARFLDGTAWDEV
jgi:hypothetical protein